MDHGNPTSRFPQDDSDVNPPSPTVTLSATPRPTTPHPHIIISPASTLSPSSSTSSYPREPHAIRITYPLLSTMPAAHLQHFHKGAQIALENISNDYLRNPDMSLLEVLSDLEDKRPKVGFVREDWERRCVVQGAEWVGKAVEWWWGEWMGEGGGSLDEDEESMGDEIEVGKAEFSEREDGEAGDGQKNEQVRDNAPEKGDEHQTGLREGDREYAEELQDVDAIAEELDCSETDKGDGNNVEPEERDRDEKEVRVLVCLLELLERWIDLQAENASKEG